MMKAKALQGIKSDVGYIPKYRDCNGKLVEMKKNSARLRTDFGITVLEFNIESEEAFVIRLGNSMRKNSIYSLRASIYQTGEDDLELKELKGVMIDELEKAERNLLISYLRTTTFDLVEIK